MAESPLSPIGAVVDLQHSSASVVLNENSAISMDATAAALDGNYVSGAGNVGLDLQCPATPHLPLKLPEISSSSSDTDGEEQQAQLNSGANAADGDENGTGRPTSPPPNCAICLGRCKNKCFTDSCMHQFCFKCLCEWSKVKPECPLCKQTFKSIIHNVKSIDQFEEYHVQQPTVQIPHRPIQVAYGRLPYIVEGVYFNGRNQYEYAMGNYREPGIRIVRTGRTIIHPTNYSSSGVLGESASGSSRNVNESASVGGGNVRNQFIHRGELLDLYRHENPGAIASNGTLSQLWRRFVYDRKLYAMPVCDITGRFRESTARFYRDNPAQIHRLMPWINRDIVCLLRNSEHDVSIVLERVHESLTHVNILSPDFRRRMQPYLGSKTAHFIHELNNFARSPYDMIGYDRAVQYSPQNAEEVVVDFSSTTSSSTSSDEDNPNATAENGNAARVRSRDPPIPRSISDYRLQSRSAISPPLPPSSLVNLLSFSISASQNTESPGLTVSVSGRGAQSTAINLTTHNRASEVIIDLDEMEVDASATETDVGASTSASVTVAPPSPATPVVTENIELNTTSSDDCEFVLERKPPHLRTPELVSLNSESDSDVVFVDEIKPQLTDDEAGPSNKNDKELYNVGASTSTGLRQSSRRRMQVLRDAEIRAKQTRRRRSLRSTRKNSGKMYRTKRYESETEFTSTSSQTDNDSDEYYGKQRKPRSKSVKQQKNNNTNEKLATARSAKKKTKTVRDKKRSHSKENNKKGSKKQKLNPAANTSDCSSEDGPLNHIRESSNQQQQKTIEAINTNDDYSTDDGEGLNLMALKRRFQEEMANEANNRIEEVKPEVTSANIKLENHISEQSEVEGRHRNDLENSTSGSECYYPSEVNPPISGQSELERRHRNDLENSTSGSECYYPSEINPTISGQSEVVGRHRNDLENSTSGSECYYPSEINPPISGQSEIEGRHRNDLENSTSGSECYGPREDNPVDAQLYGPKNMTNENKDSSNPSLKAKNYVCNNANNENNVTTTTTTTTEEPVNTIEDESTFSSITQTSTCKTRSTSRTSAHSYSTHTSTSTSVSSTSSITSSSTPSVSWGCSTSAEDSDSNDVQNANPTESNVLNLNLTLEQMLNTTQENNDEWSTNSNNNAEAIPQTTTQSTIEKHTENVTIETPPEPTENVSEITVAANEAAVALVDFANPHIATHSSVVQSNTDLPIYSEGSSDIDQDYL